MSTQPTFAPRPYEPKPAAWPVLPPDVDTLPNGARRCTAKARDRDEEGNRLDTWHRCMAAAIRGGTVCQSHSGVAPQVRQNARIKLLELVDPAVATLAREMTQADKSADRLRAAENVLDRAGFPRAASFDVVESKQLLITRLKAMRDSAYAEEELGDGDDDGVIDVLAVDE